ncbi:MAG: CoA ester lyase, partial [Hyphomicrobiaceae bacterium]
QLRRSKLFVPGNRRDFMRKAAAGPADSLSLDLEDAVPAAEKAEARRTVMGFLASEGAQSGKHLVVRVNPLDSGLMVGDILAVAVPELHCINVPKCDSPKPLHVADAVLAHVERERGLAGGSIALMANLETPAALRNAHAIATACPRVKALQLGFGDLKASTGLRPDTHRLGAIRTMTILAAAEAGIEAYDSAWVDVADHAGFEADAMEARSMGFAGKSCIHPSQVEACNRIFAPDAAALDEARALIETYEAAEREGRGAVLFRGRLVDAVHVAEARRLLTLAS